MIAFVFFGVVIAFIATLYFIDKIHSYNNSQNSIWYDGDSVIILPGDATEACGGFGTRIKRMDDNGNQHA